MFTSKEKIHEKSTTKKFFADCNVIDLFTFYIYAKGNDQEQNVKHKTYPYNIINYYVYVISNT